MNRIRLALALLGLLLASACQPPLAASTPTPSPEPSVTPAPLKPTDTPVPVEETLTPSTHASPVAGSVLLQDGLCCVGGIAGGAVTITAAFQAQSLSGEVTEMRVANGGPGCRTEAELNAFAWEPFASAKTYQFEGIPINWIGYYVSVQYRDAQGNLSPVYCDDVSVEGMPPPPTSPTP